MLLHRGEENERNSPENASVRGETSNSDANVVIYADKLLLIGSELSSRSLFRRDQGFPMRTRVRHT
jgi:hypothetical protein